MFNEYLKNNLRGTIVSISCNYYFQIIADIQIGNGKTRTTFNLTQDEVKPVLDMIHEKKPTYFFKTEKDLTKSSPKIFCNTFLVKEFKYDVASNSFSEFNIDGTKVKPDSISS